MLKKDLITRFNVVHADLNISNMLKKDLITKFSVVHADLNLTKLLINITEGVDTIENVCANLKSL